MRTNYMGCRAGTAAWHDCGQRQWRRRKVCNARRICTLHAFRVCIGRYLSTILWSNMFVRYRTKYPLHAVMRVQGIPSWVWCPCLVHRKVSASDLGTQILHRSVAIFWIFRIVVVFATVVRVFPPIRVIVCRVRRSKMSRSLGAPVAFWPVALSSLGVINCQCLVDNSLRCPAQVVTRITTWRLDSFRGNCWRPSC